MDTIIYIDNVFLKSKTAMFRNDLGEGCDSPVIDLFTANILEGPVFNPWPG